MQWVLGVLSKYYSSHCKTSPKRVSLFRDGRKSHLVCLQHQVQCSEPHHHTHMSHDIILISLAEWIIPYYVHHHGGGGGRGTGGGPPLSLSQKGKLAPAPFLNTCTPVPAAGHPSSPLRVPHCQGKHARDPVPREDWPLAGGGERGKHGGGFCLWRRASPRSPPDLSSAVLTWGVHV